MSTLRIPRPLGLTNLVIAYKLDPTEENKQRINQHIVDSYINNGFTYNFRKMTVDELSKITGIPLPIILMNITRATRTLARLSKPEQMAETIQSLLGLVIQNSMTDRSEIVEQLHNLKVSQGGEYKAFISREVNAALKLLMDSNVNILKVVEALNPGKTLIQINNTNQQPVDNINNVTPDKAVILITQNKTPLKEDQLLLENLYKDEGIEDTPIVDARKQTGEFGKKEGLTLHKITEIKKKGEPITHENRRLEELDIDEEADEI